MCPLGILAWIAGKVTGVLGGVNVHMITGVGSSADITDGLVVITAIHGQELALFCFPRQQHLVETRSTNHMMSDLRVHGVCAAESRTPGHFVTNMMTLTVLFQLPQTLQAAKY